MTDGGEREKKRSRRNKKMKSFSVNLASIEIPSFVQYILIVHSFNKCWRSHVSMSLIILFNSMQSRMCIHFDFFHPHRHTHTHFSFLWLHFTHELSYFAHETMETFRGFFISLFWWYRKLEIIKNFFFFLLAPSILKLKFMWFFLSKSLDFIQELHTHSNHLRVKNFFHYISLKFKRKQEERKEICINFAFWNTKKKNIKYEKQ